MKNQRLCTAMCNASIVTNTVCGNRLVLRHLGESMAVAVGAADDQHIFDLNVRLQYSDDEVVLLLALQVGPPQHSATVL